MAKRSIPICHSSSGVLAAHALGGRLICLGREGEHITQKLTFDVSVWLEDMPDAWVDIHVSPPDGEGYLVPLDAHDGKAVWTITQDDLAQAGYGSIELIATDPTTGERKKSSTARTIIHESQSHKEPEDVPPRHVPWWEKVLAAIRGVVRSVNGILPDENGDVKIEVGGVGLPSVSAPHQMLVTDADGKTVWEERTHYSSYETVIEKQAAAFTVDGESGFFQVPEFSLTPDAEYIVDWDGEKHKCTAYSVEYVVLLGNGKQMGLEDTGEPFAIIMNARDSFYAVFAYSNDNEHTFSVSRVGDTKIIDEKYIPDSIKGGVTYFYSAEDATSPGVVITDVLYKDSDCTEEVTPIELHNAISRGMVRIHYATHSSNSWIEPYCVYNYYNNSGNYNMSLSCIIGIDDGEIMTVEFNICKQEK